MHIKESISYVQRPVTNNFRRQHGVIQLLVLVSELFSVSYYIANTSVTMAGAFVTTMQMKVFDQSIFTIITDLTKKHKCTDINNIQVKS